MKNATIISIVLTALVFASCSQADERLTFRPDGTFKILQLTDLHLQLFRPAQVADVFARMDSIVRWEDPDLITVTGDLIYSTPADSMMQPIIDRLDTYKRPWVIVYGNHDHEHGRTLAELASLIVRGKHTLNTLAPSGTLADIEIPVGDSAYLFFLDSHAYSTDPVDYSNFSYAWFTDEQVQWVRETAGKHPDKPSIAFFHIPFPEYADAAKPVGEPDRTKIINRPDFLGTFGEWVCCGKYNPGMFDAMKESGFTATFCGHDHDNDYAASYNGMLLAYGRYSGSNGEYNHLPKGARIIVLHQDTPTIDTWIREGSGAIVQNYSYQPQ